MAKTAEKQAPRKRRTPAEKAQQALDVALRKLGRAKARMTEYQGYVDDASRDVERLTAEVDYLQQHPALQTPEQVDPGRPVKDAPQA